MTSQLGKLSFYC